MTLRQRGRAAVVCTFATILLLLTGTAAVAHGGGSDARYYRTQITGTGAAPAGITARVDPAGEWIEVAYQGAGEVVILGYFDEPYLRVTAAAVDENVLSQSTYLNQAMFAEVPTSASDPAVEPKWHKIATNGVARWHDHRIHWMTQARPPVVAADPGHPHTVGSWTVKGLANSKPFVITGTIRWLGRPQGLPAIIWYLVYGVFGLLAVLTVGHIARRRPANVARQPSQA